MSKPKLLDLFCGAGGAGAGYAYAGFEVTGIDVAEQPYYPYEFIWAEAQDVLKGNVIDLSQFDVIHASPPCQFYSKNVSKDDVPPGLIKVVRHYINKLDKPYVIENVTGAESYMIEPGMLCGAQFGRPTRRHRLFETNMKVEWPYHHKRMCWGISRKFAEERGIDRSVVSVTGHSGRTGTLDIWREIMQMPWAKRGIDLREAIFPAYTEYIGKQIIRELA